DGLFAAARLAGRGVRVTVVRTSRRIHGAGLAAARDAGVEVLVLAGAHEPADPEDVIVPVAQAAAAALAADVVVDAVLGIGAAGGLRGPASALVREILRQLGDAVARPPARARRPALVAVDVPSGIGVADGSVPGPVLPADLTVACGALSAGLLLPPAARLSPRVEVIDLGMTPTVPPAADPIDAPVSGVRRVQDRDVAALWPRPGPGDDKYRRGVVGVVAGTDAYPGAAVLSTAGALGAGAGMVRYLGPAAVTAAVLAAHPEVVHGAGRVQAWVVGPGVDPQDAEQARHVARALGDAGLGGEAHFAPSGVWGSGAGQSVVPVVVDAGALALLPERCPPWAVLTPHAGELARLLGERGHRVERAEVEAAPLHHARLAGAVTGATILLKGSTTIVVGPGGVFSQAEAPAWLATAGAGDVLAGLLGTVLAGHSAQAVQHPDVVARCAALAALVHGRAAHDANPGGPVRAGAVAAAVPGTVARLLAAGDAAPGDRDPGW
ncbi:MAG: bifunctional ADP-dependent NAD(P)H-hydrate dehydratase/NAD(P)H-hydrate epimerase, partial [Cellulomonadaceae bacterium]